jgi:enamine deaminase RidA (YjgF/YER057c/UK114 family)
MAKKEVVAFGPFKDFIADGVRVGDTIHLSGSVSVDDQGKTLHAGDIVAQARHAYANIATVLGKFGATMDDIVYETLFVTDMSAVMGDEQKMGAFFGARGEAYGGNPQVSQSLIGVNELAAPGLMIEIKVVAHA